MKRAAPSPTAGKGDTASKSAAQKPLLGMVEAGMKTPQHVTAIGHSLLHIMYCVGVWVINFVRLVSFSVILIPAFLPYVFRYVTDKRIVRGVRFGDGRRCVMDIYMPAEAVAARDGNGEPVPVVIAVMGGAWVIGYRAWNVQLGLRMLDAGVMVVAVDYRNFPFAQVPEMMEDVERGVAWVFDNIAAYGGDPTNMVLAGQSAGAHLSSMVLLKQALAEAMSESSPKAISGQETPTSAGSVSPKSSDGSPTSSDGTPASSASSTPSCRNAPKRGEVAVQCQGSWSASSLRGYVGISGAYDLELLGERLQERGFSDALLRSMCPEEDVGEWSPRQLLDSKAWKAWAHKAVPLLPPIRVYHGGRDKTVPAASSEEFIAALQAHDVDVDAVAEILPELAHAEVVIEGPLRGEDHQVKWLLPLLLETADAKIESLPPLTVLLPRFVFDLASAIMPF